MAHPSTREHNHDLEYIGIMKVNIDQSSYERIASRHREQDEVAFKNKETVEACLSKIVGRGGIGGYEREVLRAWAQELLELLSRPYTDSGYNFYVSGAKWMIERVEEFQRRLMWQMMESFYTPEGEKRLRVKDEDSAGKLALEFVARAGSPVRNRSIDLTSMAEKVVKLYESADKKRGKQAKAALAAIIKQIKAIDVRLTFEDRGNWAKINDKFWVILNTPIERFKSDPGLYDRLMNGYDVRTFIATLRLDLPESPDELPPRPAPAGLRNRASNALQIIFPRGGQQRSLDHRRITSRYASIAQVPTHGPARHGGVHF